MRSGLGLWVLLLGAGFFASAAHAQDCEDDSDCPDGLGCDHSPVGGSVGCQADGGSCDPAVGDQPSEGRCEPQEVTCEKDSDCPAGLVCGQEDSHDDVTLDCAARDGADASCELPEDDEPEEATRACTFEPEGCETDADCSMAGFGCLEAQGASECRSSSPACDSDGDCPDAAIDEECDEPESIRYCFPERVDCNDDGDCDDDWRCVELPNNSGDDVPESWVGATDVCLPEGLARAVEGTIELGRNSGAGSDDADSLGGGEPKDADDDASHDDDGEHDGDSGGDDDDDGCSISRAGAARSDAHAGFFLLALTMLLARRARSRAR